MNFRQRYIIVDYPQITIILLCVTTILQFVC
jgi:hypothetical protein